MAGTGGAGELASARLEIPTPSLRRRRSGREPGAIEASFHDEDGSLLVTFRTNAAQETLTLPLLACLQFISRFEDAAAEVLTLRDLRNAQA